MTTSGQAAGSDLVAKAHARLLGDSSLQFHFTTFRPPTPPDWLPALLKALQALGPALKIVFWIGLAALAAWLVYAAARLVVQSRRGGAGERPGGLSLQGDAASLAPSAGRARALLEEADRLAAQDRFAEAVHVLLYRTIADFDDRRPRALRPALTSRDIARLADIPARARAALALIVEQVERSFFGGRSLDAQDFTLCREAYLTFSSPASWTSGAAA